MVLGYERSLDSLARRRSSAWRLALNQRGACAAGQRCELYLLWTERSASLSNLVYLLSFEAILLHGSASILQPIAINCTVRYIVLLQLEIFKYVHVSEWVMVVTLRSSAKEIDFFSVNHFKAIRIWTSYEPLCKWLDWSSTVSLQNRNSTRSHLGYGATCKVWNLFLYWTNSQEITSEKLDI